MDLLTLSKMGFDLLAKDRAKKSDLRQYVSEVENLIQSHIAQMSLQKSVKMSMEQTKLIFDLTEQLRERNNARANYGDSGSSSSEPS